MMKRLWRMLTVCCFALTLSIPVQVIHADPVLLSPDQAFGLTWTDQGRDVRLRFHVAPGYRLYRDRVMVSDAPGEIAGRVPLAAMLPPGSISYNSALGETVETYDHDFEADVSTPSARPLRIVVRVQGCADVGVCYPPVERIISLSGR